MDYTPTTEEVRRGYVRAFIGVTRYEGKAESLEELFDRWLAEVKAQQDKETTERIIALLEADCFCQAPEDQHPCWPCQTIALIKGENNE